MVSTRNHYGLINGYNYGKFRTQLDPTQHCYYHDIYFIIRTTDSLMAEEDTKTGGGGDDGCRGRSGTGGDDEGEEGDVGTSDSTRFSGGTGEIGGVGNEEWLQLGIGRRRRRRSTSPANRGKDADDHRSEDLLELSLFSKRPQSRPELPTYPFSPIGVSTARTGISSELYRGLRFPRFAGWEMWNVGGTSSPMPPVTLPPVSNYRPPQQLTHDVIGSGNLGFPAAESGRNPVEEITVVSPPPRPTNDLWFVLQASNDQAIEPFLPQIPKIYLRIKNRGMTILFLMKYLAIKLGLDTESEVEITCRGQPLPPHLTLLQVRDNIWCSREITPTLQDSTLNHLMTLQYRRSI